MERLWTASTVHRLVRTRALARAGIASLLLVCPLLAAAGCSRGAEETPAAERAREDAGEERGPRSSRRSFSSSGRKVPATLVLPAGPGERPLVILLHGRSGLPYYGERLEALGHRLAAAGIGALIPDYFVASGDEAPAEITDPAFRVWRWVLADAVVAAGSLDEVDSEAIGVAGFSLGGFIALTEAAGNPRIRSVAANYAGISAYFPNELARFPPLLVVHASGDPVVPVAQAEDLAQRVRAVGAEAELAIYPGESHVLEGETWESAAERMVAFFRRTLGGAPGAESGSANGTAGESRAAEDGGAES